MEIIFESRDTSVYREYCNQIRRTQESVECVVPDTEADIEKIASAQSGVYLKSKDLSARGVVISGEVFATVLYIRDGQAGISSIRVRKAFTLEYEADAPESETLTQIALYVQGTDVRVINPRKISVSFEIEGVLSCYRNERLCVETVLPDSTAGLHIKTETQTLTLPNAVCEKSFSLNEQFVFSDGQTAPTCLISEKASLQISDCQLLGSKMVVKGSAELMICGQSDKDAILRTYQYSAPFSQIIDIGAEGMQYCTVRPELTGAYFDLIDTISGEKALDLELHAVIQLVCFECRTIRCVSDAYSNRMPGELVRRTLEFALASEAAVETLRTEERVGLMEKAAELVTVFPSLSRVSSDDGKLSAAVTLDFLYFDADGKLSACRRTIALSEDLEGRQLQILRIGPVQWSAKPDGEYADCSVSVELICCACENETISSVTGIVLDEERAYLQGSLPTLTLARREGESLWALAKRYHSSEEKIRELNEDADNSTRMLLIPKCI